jgi:predicted negative regulator of RcsB-dependent stress response
MKSIIVVLLLAAAAWFGFGKYQDRAHAQREAELANQPVKKKPAALPTAKAGEPGVSFFSCDGRSSCRQMTSCEEAKYFVRTCPGFETGVFGEEASCEKQWCKK